MTETGNIVISPETVRQKAEEVAELEKKAAEAKEQLRLLVGYLRLVGRADWIPENLVIATPTRSVVEVPHRLERGSWPSEIAAVIANAPEGATFSDIRDELAKGPIAERLRNNPNGFYSGVARLEKAGEAIKYKERLFSRQNYDAFMGKVKRGEVADLSGADGKPTVADALVEFINRHPGAAPRDIVDEMVRDGTVPSAGSVYNNLSKVAAKGRVKRKDGRYYPVKENEPPTGEPEDGSETGEAATSLFESRT